MSPALDGIEEALAVYPAGFVSKLCKTIFICGSLNLGGAEAGGSYGPNWLVLVATEKVGVEGIFETAHLGVHHELSSLVWNAAADLSARWVALLPPDGSPAQTNAEALAAAREEPIQRNDGFLSAYAATTAENDFNTFAETAFAAPARLAPPRHGCRSWHERRRSSSTRTAASTLDSCRSLRA